MSLIQIMGESRKMKMNNLGIIRTTTKLIFSLLLLVTFMYVTKGSSTNSKQSEVQKLIIVLTTGKPTQCFGSKLLIEAEIKNKGDEAIAIDPGLLFYKISFAVKGSEGVAGSGFKTIIGNPGPNYENKFIVLPPGESYKRPLTLPLKDNFFTSPSDYTVAVTYGQFGETASFNETKVFKGTVQSNEVAFTLVKCRENTNKKRRASSEN